MAAAVVAGSLASQAVIDIVVQSSTRLRLCPGFGANAIGGTATHRDVDTIGDAWAVAAEAPAGFFFACLATMAVRRPDDPCMLDEGQ